jgi:hypothetical protein
VIEHLAIVPSSALLLEGPCGLPGIGSRRFASGYRRQVRDGIPRSEKSPEIFSTDRAVRNKLTYPSPAMAWLRKAHPNRDLLVRSEADDDEAPSHLWGTILCGKQFCEHGGVACVLQPFDDRAKRLTSI